MPWDLLNVAVTDAFALSDTLHVPVPLQPPDQPENDEPAAGVAVSVTAVPVAKFAVHVLPQLIPDGLLLIVPLPEPPAETVNW